MIDTLILDVDGTLIDTNYHHVLGWSRAFHEHGSTVALWKVHRALGMGGDKPVEHLLGAEAERVRGDAIRASEARLYGELIGEVEPLAEARELLIELRAAKLTVVLASSAKEAELDHYLDLLDARDLVAGWTSSADVETTKPDPDIVHAALKKAGGSSAALMIGDTTWDVIAATAAGIPTLCVTTGGFAAQELRDAGAVGVVESLAEVRRHVRDGADGF